MFEKWNDPRGNPLISINRDGTLSTEGVNFSDGSKQVSASNVFVKGAIPEGHTLQWDGTEWVPVAIPGSTTYNVAYCTDYTWAFTNEVGFTALTAGVPATIAITKAPAGFNAANLNVPYWIYISGTGTAEAVLVTGGSATPNNSGTIEFTPYYDHTTGYTVGTATSGIQEAINANAGTSSGNPDWFNGYAKIVIPPILQGGDENPYPIYGRITLQGDLCRLEGYGAALDHQARGPMIQLGDLLSSTHSNNNTVAGLVVRNSVAKSEPEYVGSLITTTVRSGGTNTITTAAAHGLRPGDPVTILFTDNVAYWGDVPAVATVPSSTTFTYTTTDAADIGQQATPGVVALTYVAFLDNSNGTHFEDISLDYQYSRSTLNGVFDLWDDENCVINNFNNNGSGLNCNANWTSSFIASYGAGNLPNQSQQLAPVVSLTNSCITAQFANGVTVFNNNGLYISNTVIQANGPWQVNASNQVGNYQGVAIENLYSEANYTNNPASPVRSPWPGCGIAGLISGPCTGDASISVRGQGVPNSPRTCFPLSGSSGTLYSYFVVANDTTMGVSTAPMPVMYAKSTGGSVTVSWPRISNGTDAITYDVLRVAGDEIANIASVGPYTGGCPGGSTAAMGSVVTGQAQQGGFVQTFTDNTDNDTSSYATVGLGSYTGNLIFWPGQCVTVFAPIVSDIPLQVVPAGLYGNPGNICIFGKDGGYSGPSGTSAFSTRWDANNAISNHQALLLNDGVYVGGSSSPNTKGRLNFQTSGLAAITPGHIITLVDSNPQKTRATAANRPLNDADDVWIGQDAQGNVATNAAQLAMGAPGVISQYIGNIGDNTSYKERLTATSKTFTVPIVIPTASPTSAGTAGVTGQLGWDGSNFYVCTAGGAAGHATWKAAALSSV